MLVSMMTGMGILGTILPIIIYLFCSFMLFLIARKTNTNLPWLTFIPIANVILMINIAGKPLKWLLLFLVPILAPLLGLLAPMGPNRRDSPGMLSPRSDPCPDGGIAIH